MASGKVPEAQIVVRRAVASYRGRWDLEVTTEVPFRIVEVNYDPASDTVCVRDPADLVPLE